MNLKYVLLAAALGALFGAVSSHYVSRAKVKGCETKVIKAQEQINEFCGGHDLGGARLTNVTCNNKKEICICGDPDMLKPVY